MIKIDISIDQIILHKKKERKCSSNRLYQNYTPLLQKSFLLLTVSHSKDEREFVVTNYLFLSNLSMEYWRFKVVNMKVYQLRHCLEKKILPRKKKKLHCIAVF
jgi:hypothetical protein